MELLKKLLAPVILGLSVLMLVIMFASFGPDPAEQNVATNVGLYTGYALMIAGIVGIILGFILTAITNPASILRTIAGVVVILVVWGISYALANNEVTAVYEKFKITPSLSQTIGSILILTYTLGILTIIGIVITEVTGAFK